MPVIISGKRRGAKLSVPEGIGVRPTLVRVREALFSMLTSELGTFEGCRVLDPFAGAGMLGLESWSRGAAHVDFFELNRAHLAILQKNIRALKAENEVTTFQGESPKDWYRLAGRKYDLVLCDPPYAAGLLPQTLLALVERELLNPGAIVSVELNAEDEFECPEPFEVLKNRKYGKCRVCLVQLKRANEETEEGAAV